MPEEFWSWALAENNNIDEFKKVMGEYNPDKVKFLGPGVEDEIQAEWIL